MNLVGWCVVDSARLLLLLLRLKVISYPEVAGRGHWPYISLAESGGGGGPRMRKSVVRYGCAAAPRVPGRGPLGFPEVRGEAMRREREVPPLQGPDLT